MQLTQMALLTLPSATSVEGYSAFGSYTGSRSTNGPFIYTG